MPWPFQVNFDYMHIPESALLLVHRMPLIVLPVPEKLQGPSVNDVACGLVSQHMDEVGKNGF